MANSGASLCWASGMELHSDFGNGKNDLSLLKHNILSGGLGGREFFKRGFHKSFKSVLGHKEGNSWLCQVWTWAKPGDYISFKVHIRFSSHRKARKSPGRERDLVLLSTRSWKLNGDVWHSQMSPYLFSSPRNELFQLNTGGLVLWLIQVLNHKMTG